MNPADAAGAAPGLQAAAQRVLADVIDIGRTRLELAAVELEEERLRITALLIHAALALILLFVGLLLAAAWIVLWCEPAQRATAAGWLTSQGNTSARSRSPAGSAATA